MKRAILFVASLLPAVLLTAGCGGDAEAEVGKPLPVWSEGCLDIHAINTGRGECTFFILPDGTTLTVDAGEFSSESKRFRNVPQRPDTLTRPSHTYARYMKHFMPRKDTMDYFLLTHFHMDHMGQLEPEYATAADGGYVLSGVTALYGELPFRELVDRAWPDYDSLACQAMSTAALANYRRFVDYAAEHRGLKPGRLQLGSSSQFPLKYDAARYPDFRIANICANGCVWDGERIVDCYDGAPRKENGASCGILVQYGDFDYFTAGDAGSNTRVEYPCARSIGGSIEAMKAHHHLSPHTMEPETMEILQPDVVVTQSFYVRDIQPDREIIRRLSESGATRLYFTNIDRSLTEVDPELYGRCAAIGGHIVIRVAPGGKEYSVYQLDDTDASYRVLRIDGPFTCKPIKNNTENE
ncbi:MAG: hypothetical protein K2K30_08445 [Alistipes sp.]|nr:hypothetical protein [Alistipes sp.]